MILVIGGAGYIGSHTNKELNKYGYDTLVLDNLITGYKDFVKWGKFIYGDFGDINCLIDIFKNYNIEAVMHFSAFAYVGESVYKPDKYYINNVIKTINLLNIMKDFGINKFIFSSSCATYGIPDKIPIDEDTVQNPINPYGKTKYMIEKILEDYSNAYGLKYIILRYFNAAGADIDTEIGELHDPETHLIPLVINTALGIRDSIEVFGNDYNTDDGSCIRDYIHVSDLANAHVLALKFLKRENKNEIFNLGSEKGFSVFNIIDYVKKITGKNFKVEIKPRRDGDPPILIASSQKAKKYLEWKPKYTDIETIIQTALEWHKKIFKVNI